MTGLPGFTDNPFRSRSDLLQAAKALIRPLNVYKSSSGARVKVRPSTVAAFDDVAAQLEGFARPLWAIYAIIDDASNQTEDILSSWICGIQAGVDPNNPEYWGHIGSFDQRMVEMESIAFALLESPHLVFKSLCEASINNLKIWLLQINHHDMPRSNWRWFRVLVNLALVRSFGVPQTEVQHIVDADFAILDEFYLGDGWSSDGSWGDERKQADYYSGSFAIQFAQLLYVRFAKGDEKRVATYRQQAREFGAQYWRYFDKNGAAIPFGRSMTYRFAFAAFWSALALSEIDLPKPIEQLGSVKGMLMRHLRWWAKHPNIFNADGVLNIGFSYPNMYLSEDYNSPQSVYWCLKSFVVLGLPETHEFWTCKELPHPAEFNMSLNTIQVNWHPRQILCNTPEHHFLLSSGQMTTKEFKAREAKYGKLAYSSLFAFSVPTGPLLHQMAPDSTLSISLDDGETWKVRSCPFNIRLETITIEVGHTFHETSALVSIWKPFKHINLQIETVLVPVMEQFPGWHVRIHTVRGLASLKGTPGVESFQVVDASFAIPAFKESGHHIPKLNGGVSENPTEACWDDQSSIFAESQSGASGIAILNITETDKSCVLGTAKFPELGSKAFLIAADPNTNLVSPRTFIPSIKHLIELPKSQSEGNSDQVTLASGVFGASRENIEHARLLKMWNRRPRVRTTTGTSLAVIIHS